MVSPLVDRVRKFATSPEGRKVFAEAKKVAKDPAAKRRIDEARKKLQGDQASPSTRA